MIKLILKNPSIAVIGHLVKDEIESPDGSFRTALGGIAYNLATLDAVARSCTILPICRIGNDMKELMHSSFNSNRFDFSLIKYSSYPNVVNRLKYKPDGTRNEWNSRRQAPLSFDGVGELVDAVILNFISGNDVGLSQLLKFRSVFRGLIYCDFHSLSLGIDENNKRYYRRHPFWRRYLGACDLVQLNLLELDSLFDKPILNPKDIRAAGLKLIEFGPKAIIITAGREGAYLVEDSDSFYYVPPIKIRKEIDPTGCGDTLGSSFIYKYLRTGDPLLSLEWANHLAAAKATFFGLKGYLKLEEIAAKIGPANRASRI
jgi:hypothetical protein